MLDDKNVLDHTFCMNDVHIRQFSSSSFPLKVRSLCRFFSTSVWPPCIAMATGGKAGVEAHSLDLPLEGVQAVKDRLKQDRHRLLQIWVTPRAALNQSIGIFRDLVTPTAVLNQYIVLIVDLVSRSSDTKRYTKSVHCIFRSGHTNNGTQSVQCCILQT